MSYGLVGKTIGHSLSPRLHRLLGGYDYSLFELGEGDAEAFLRAGKYDGLNVTMPYKRLAALCCDELSPEAAATGSVNTIVRRGERLCGYNTDCYGFEYMARRAGISLRGERIAVLGSGGAAAAVRYAAQRLGSSQIATVSRGGELNYNNLAEHRFDIIINATPVGSFPELLAAPVELHALPPPKAVLDVVYNPLRTALCREAASLGLPNAGGLSMLAAQAAAAAELFSGKSIGARQIESAISAVTAETRNIVLIGMAGCGKSTVGAALAQRLGRDCTDTDEELRHSFGMEIPEIFARRGEAVFRAREAEEVQNAALISGGIIATGGGSVLNENSLAALRASGVIVLLERDIERCATCGRPLSADADTLRRLYAEREPIYRAAADIEIDNNGSVGETVAAIMKELEL